MKKVITFFAVFLLSSGFYSSIYASGISVVLEHQNVDFKEQKPLIISNRVLVPIREVSEELEYEVDWNPATKTVTLYKYDNVVSITANKEYIVVNGEEVSIDVGGQIIDNSFMLPLRALSEAVGMNVSWDDSSKSIFLNTNVSLNNKLITNNDTKALQKVNISSDIMDYAAIEEFYLRIYVLLQLSGNTINDCFQSITNGVYSNEDDELLNYVLAEVNEYSNLINAINVNNDSEILIKNIAINIINKDVEILELVMKYVNRELNKEEYEQLFDMYNKEFEKLHKELNLYLLSYTQVIKDTNKANFSTDGLTDEQVKELSKFIFDIKIADVNNLPYIVQNKVDSQTMLLNSKFYAEDLKNVIEARNNEFKNISVSNTTIKRMEIINLSNMILSKILSTLDDYTNDKVEYNKALIDIHIYLNMYDKFNAYGSEGNMEFAVNYDKLYIDKANLIFNDEAFNNGQEA